MKPSSSISGVQALALGICLLASPLRADAISLNNGEEYSGRVVSSNGDSVVFDLECTNSVYEISWDEVSAIEFSDDCINDYILGRGGRDWCDGSTFRFYIGTKTDEDFAADVIDSSDGYHYSLNLPGDVVNTSRAELKYVFRVDCVSGQFRGR